MERNYYLLLENALNVTKSLILILSFYMFGCKVQIIKTGHPCLFFSIKKGWESVSDMLL